MIRGIERWFGRSPGSDPWSADQELKPELEEGAGAPSENPMVEATTDAPGHYAPAGADAPDYYKSLVQTAIMNGGKHGDHAIPIPWLRMILAGLEFKHIEPEMVWYGFEAGEAAEELRPELPSYDELFPSNGGAPSRPGYAAQHAAGAPRRFQSAS